MNFLIRLIIASVFVVVAISTILLMSIVVGVFEGILFGYKYPTEMLGRELWRF